jgi:lipopolysaccharide transport system permease protein
VISAASGTYSAVDPRLATQRWGQRWDLLQALIARDIKLRYRGSILGVLWTLLNPLAELLVLLFVFGVVVRVGIPNFGAYLFLGLVVYGWFSTSVSFATGAVVSNRELVRRPGMPLVILPVVTVASNLVHFLLSLPILGALLVFSGVHITPALLALPLLIVIQFVLILASSYPVAVAHVWFRDTQHLLRIALQLLFYLTPIFYEVDTVPAGGRWIYQVNPMAHLVDVYRAVLLHGKWPSTGSLVYLTVISSALLVVGIYTFQRASRRFVDEL